MEPREMVEKIAEKEFPQEAVERIYPAEGGFAHDTFFIEFENESFVVKINGLSEYTEKQDRDWNAGFETEPYVLDLILEDTDVPVPEPVARHTSKTVIPEYYHVLRKMEGYAPTKSSSETNFRDLGQDKKKNILEEIGRNIANIQHIEFKKFGEIRLDENTDLCVENGKTWPEQFRETLFFWTDKLEGGEFEDLADKVEDVVENNLDLIDGVDRPVLVHREIDTKNILVKDGELNAILDWENCMAGHGELDLVITEARMIESSFSTDKVWEKYRKELYGGYREIRALEDGWRERRQLYLLFPFVWEMAFYPDSGSNSEETIRRRVEEVLQSLEN